jgi:hypothetical protein
MLIARVEPVPAAQAVRRSRLFGIGDEKALLFRQPVHPRPGGEILGPLTAAMQHDDQRHFPAAMAAWHIDPVFPSPREIGEFSGEPASLLRRDSLRSG